ncbi:DNA-binding MurR/RpiR family transcriptional regulator [Rhizobium sp. BK226]|nr:MULTISPECIES: MurR/RpiR family transcriptional regulator [Rhizobium]MBB4112648.1 DNA-binding MurR/RpiR family transcriptional regulator [Rhizobium sp. BK226]MBB4252606.1 DNA-binding MurR/RpiR family transcriptional regulator [Rhizobium sp. BK008]UTS88075.1 MurR/RpiR family transcriptional regulator [Rhizobium anhuiense bv. trifolii]
MIDIERSARPTTIKDLKGLVVSRTVVLPDQLKKVAQFAFERPEEMAFGTIKSISVSCGVAPQTVLRLAHAFGFNCFRDFKALFRAHLRNIAID